MNNLKLKNAINAYKKHIADVGDIESINERKKGCYIIKAGLQKEFRI